MYQETDIVRPFFAVIISTILFAFGAVVILEILKYHFQNSQQSAFFGLGVLDFYLSYRLLAYLVS